MTVSVITPLYNSEKTIKETVMSVINQSFKDWELIIIDDCSSDNSNKIIADLAKNEPRIKLYKTKEPSGSPSIPRNIGIDNAKGDFIAFLDSDDLWYENKLEEQLKFIQENGYDFIYSNYEKMTYDGIRNNRFIFAKDFATYNTTLGSCEIPCLTVLLRKNIIGETRFKSIQKEDLGFWLDILKKGIIAYNTGNMHGIYRESSTGRSNNKIKMLIAQWNIIRKEEKIGFFKSLWYISDYALKGFKKYLK